MEETQVHKVSILVVMDSVVERRGEEAQGQKGAQQVSILVVMDSVVERC